MQDKENRGYRQIEAETTQETLYAEDITRRSRRNTSTDLLQTCRSLIAYDSIKLTLVYILKISPAAGAVAEKPISSRISLARVIQPSSSP